jgi:hypothetical protein
LIFVRDPSGFANHPVCMAREARIAHVVAQVLFIGAGLSLYVSASDRTAPFLWAGGFLALFV